MAGLWIFGSGTEFHAGDHAAEILVAFAGFGEEGVAAAVLCGHFRADMRLNAVFFCGAMEAGGAVNAIDVGERHGGRAVGCADSNVVLRDTGSAEKTEGGFGVEFYVHGNPTAKTLAADERR